MSEEEPMHLVTGAQGSYRTWCGAAFKTEHTGLVRTAVNATKNPSLMSCDACRKAREAALAQPVDEEAPTRKYRRVPPKGA